MLGKHTFLIIGLLVAGGAPYLSSRQDEPSRLTAWSPTESPEAGSDHSVYQLASVKETEPAAPGNKSKNPFGGATTESASSTSQHTTAESSASPATSIPNSNPTADKTGERGASHLVSTIAASSKRKLPAVDGSVPIRFEEVFRLDVNSAWLMARWPRVTTGLADLNLHGYRVSLVTGTREDDVAGALTYYYDPEQVIQKMTFRGVTGDPRRLVLFCTSQYGFEREMVPDPALQVYRKQGSGGLISELRVRPAAVIRADAPRERFEVELLLAR